MIGAEKSTLVDGLAETICLASIADGATASPLMHEEARNLAMAVADRFERMLNLDGDDWGEEQIGESLWRFKGPGRCRRPSWAHD